MEVVEVFILEVRPVDALPRGAIPLDEITALDQQPRHSPMERGALIVELLPQFSQPLLPGHEASKVL